MLEDEEEDNPSPPADEKDASQESADLPEAEKASDPPPTEFKR